MKCSTKCLSGFLSGIKELLRPTTDLEALLEESFKYYLKPAQADRDIEEMFQCDVHNFNSDIISMLNGWHFSKNGELHTYPNGVIMGSFSAAMKAYPELFEKYYGEIADNTANGFVSINTALAQDGVFIYVPDGVEMDKTLQIIKMVDLEENIFVQSRNLIVLGENSNWRCINCRI